MLAMPGRLLVASPSLNDPNFARTVILLVEHDGDGAFGLVLNRPTTVPVHQVLPDWSSATQNRPFVRLGGPVSPESAFGLGRVPGGGTAPWFRPLLGTIGVVDLASGPDAILPAISDLTVFAGYAGWSTGQLDAELAEHAWIVVAALESDLTGPDPDDRWSDVLARQGGELARLANYPVEPRMN